MGMKIYSLSLCRDDVIGSLSGLAKILLCHLGHRTAVEVANRRPHIRIGLRLYRFGSLADSFGRRRRRLADRLLDSH